MSTKPIDAAVARLVRVLKSDADIRRGIRVDKRIANDGNVIIDNDLGLIRLIENIDANRSDLAANTISLIDKLTSLGQPITRDLFSSANGTLLTNHTGIDGETWAKSAGTGNFTIHNGRIYGSEVGVLISSGIPESADYHVGAQFTRFNDTGDNGIGIRVQPGANTGYFLYYNFGAFRLYRMVSGAITNLGTVTHASSSFPVVAGITATGSTIQIVIDGAVRLTVTDTVITAAGRPGLRSSTITTTTGVHLDKFYAARVPLATTAQVSNEIGVVNNTIDTEIANEADARQASDAQLDVLKRNLADAIPQGDVTNLVSNLADKAPTTYVNSEIRLKTPSARVLGSDDVTTSTSASGIGTTGVAAEYMIFSVGAYQEWRIDAYLECSNYASDGSFNGAPFGIAIPTGATLNGSVIGYRMSSQPWFPVRWTTSGLNPIWWMPAQSSGRIEIHATVKTGATTGFLVVQKAVGNAGDQLTILAGSWADAQRIINTD